MLAKVPSFHSNPKLINQFKRLYHVTVAKVLGNVHQTHLSHLYFCIHYLLFSIINSFLYMVYILLKLLNSGIYNLNLIRNQIFICGLSCYLMKKIFPIAQLSFFSTFPMNYHIPIALGGVFHFWSHILLCMNISICGKGCGQ